MNQPVAATSPDLPVCGESPERVPCFICGAPALPVSSPNVAEPYALCEARPDGAAAECIDRGRQAYRQDPEGWLIARGLEHVTARHAADIADVLAAQDEAGDLPGHHERNEP
jgi:hypothetical protein